MSVKGLALTKKVEATIGQLRTLFAVSTDGELARQLHLDKSTVSNWRRRGQVPKRFASLLEVDPNDLFPIRSVEMLSELAPYAQPIAIYRLSLYLSLSEDVKGNTDKALSVLMSDWVFNAALLRAISEVLAKQRASNIRPAAATMLILQDDMHDPSRTLAKFVVDMETDRKHNPGLQERGN